MMYTKNYFMSDSHFIDNEVEKGTRGMIIGFSEVSIDNTVFENTDR